MDLTRSTAASGRRGPAGRVPPRQCRLGCASAYAFAWVASLAGCARQPSPEAASGDSATTAATAVAPTTAARSAAGEFREARRRMVERQLRGAGIRDRRVLGAMERVPRHRFVPPTQVPAAYDDTPLPIGFGQTISQPYIVAFMTQEAQVAPGDTVLEIGTGSGYQAAVLADVVGPAGAVYSIEIVPELAARARETLAALGYANVHVRAGDGYRGWPEHAPFAAIVVTAAPDHVPPALVAQLALGGRLVIPVGPQAAGGQELLVISRDAQGVTTRRTIPVRFVPFTGKGAPDSGR